MDKTFVVAFSHNSTLAKNEPSWGSVDKTKLPRAAFAEKGLDGKKSTWGYPHHWVTGGKDSNGDGVFDSGTMYLHRGGLRAAWAAANGARSGQQSSSGIKAHLRKHLAAIGMGKQATAELYGFTIEELDKLDEYLISLGYLTLDDLRALPASELSAYLMASCE